MDQLRRFVPPDWSHVADCLDSAIEASRRAAAENLPLPKGLRMRKSHRPAWATTRHDGSWASLDQREGGTECGHKHRTSDAAFSCSRDRQHNGGINP